MGSQSACAMLRTAGGEGKKKRSELVPASRASGISPLGCSDIFSLVLSFLQHLHTF